nr:elongation factor G-like [Lytechinus pictus]
MGELHLDVLVERLKREFNILVKVGKPRVSYRETINETVELEGKYIRQTGGRGQYGHVLVRVEPHPDQNFEFANKVIGGKIPKEYISPVRQSLKENLDRGIIAGYPMVNIKATLYDGSFHDVDSSEFSFKVAAALALRTIPQKTKVIILEPIMKVQITTPTEYCGVVISSMIQRRGQVIETNKNRDVIQFHAPLGEMFGFSTNLRSITQGRGNYSMHFKGHEEAPSHISEKIIKESSFQPRSF